MELRIDKCIFYPYMYTDPFVIDTGVSSVSNLGHYRGGNKEDIRGNVYD
jgi:hypothetical protein